MHNATSAWQQRIRDGVRRHPRTFVAAVLAVAVVLWGAATGVVLKAHQVVRGVPDKLDVAQITEMAQASTFYDASDRPAFTIFKEQRREVPLSAMSRYLRQAIVAIEDQRFFEHGGVDAVRVFGAALANVREGRRAQGGSTLTQQLARQSFLTLDKTFVRKIQEVILATLIEAQFSKDEILELYLNKMYFGAGLYGAEAAALGYFGKPASDLTAAEAALLAGLVKSPSTWAPTVNLERAVSRRAVVLQAMEETGAIDAATRKRAASERVRLVDALRKEEPYGQYFKEQVRLELVERFGRDRVYEGGLKVYTTIDLGMQKAAEAEVEKALRVIEGRRKSPRSDVQRTSQGGSLDEPLQAAVVAMDVESGAVRAMVGGRDFGTSKFNRVTQAKRQPGSAFKPFVYAAALEAGYTPASLIDKLDEPIQTLQGAYVPEDEHSSASALTMRTALRTSSNRAAVRMMEEVGIKKTVAYAQRLGVGSLPSVPSLALGSGEVTLASLTSAYSVFATGGIRRSSYLIRRVEDAEGKRLYLTPDDAEQVISPQSAFLMANMLSDVINYGTAWKARQLGFKLPAAGKTGTTNEYRDAWFVGFTPTLITGVWVGYDQPQTIASGGYAAEIAVPLWAGFMRVATRRDEPRWIDPPHGLVSVQVCRVSGMRPADGCDHVTVEREDGSTDVRSMVYGEYFVRGTEPSETCPLHEGASVFGRVAGWLGAGASASPAASVPAVLAPEPPPDAAPVAPVTDVAKATPTNDEGQQTAPAEPKKRGFWSRVFGKQEKNKDPRP